MENLTLIRVTIVGGFGVRINYTCESRLNKFRINQYDYKADLTRIEY